MTSPSTESTPTPPPTTSPESTPPLPADIDDDGFDETVDCDDLNPAIHPGADERCDGFDEDCDQLVDEEAVDFVSGWADADGDGDGDANFPLIACALPDGYAPTGGDCDDQDPGRFSGAIELCDGIDQDCDATTTEDGVVSVGGEAYATIQEAVDAAGGGDVITVCPGTYLEHVTIPAFESLTLTSRDGPEVTILDGGADGVVLASDASALTLDGLTFANGFDDTPYGFGGGVVVGPSTLNVTGCVFEGNTHTDSGGALALYLTDATITDSVFRTNDAGSFGGAIWAYVANATISDTTFEDNHAGYGGGAIFGGGTTTIERATFVGNDAKTGGAAYLGSLGTDTTIVDSNFVDNAATGDGGGLWCGGFLTLTGTVFDGNTATNGGALASFFGASLDTSTFVSNEASQTGGAMVIAGNVTITSGTVQSNVANHGGGAGTLAGTIGTLVSTATDWGIDATDNLPEDVWLKSGSNSFTATGDFRCELSSGRCE